ncbi:MAG: nicotinate (nicotinamide) nucleotide adenylyltransferase [Bdellovibrionales bacterium]|nr:nicotinate (nicotinamide) nucleotide adenylyltransferase [Bdellovibrionales bacterium]
MPSKKPSQIKMGLMGGSFNPLHLGHINSLLTVKERFQLDKILIIPAFQPPLSTPLTEASAMQRLEMLHQAFATEVFLEVDGQEIKRKGTSYSYRTVENIAKEIPVKELFFIMGLDQFFTLDLWKNVPRILKNTHLIVTSRPKDHFPKKQEELPLIIRSNIKSWVSGRILLKQPFQSVFFCALKDREISSSLIKARLKNRQSIAHLVPPTVDHYIKTHRLYGIHSQFYFPKRKAFLHFCKTELEKKKSLKVKDFDLPSGALPFSDGLIASGSNPRHTKALCRHLKKRVQEAFNIQPLAVEGEKEGRWIVLDYNEWVIHIFYDYIRSFYKLEEIWRGKP